MTALPASRLAVAAIITMALVAGFVPALTAPAEASSPAIAVDLHNRLNDERRARGLHDVVWDANLAQAATTWSGRMSATGSYVHSDFGATLRSLPFRDLFSAIGENIYVLYPSYQSAGFAHRGWMRSDGHRRNMLNAYYDAVGIGVVCDADGTMWATMTMGRHANSTRPAYQNSVPANPIVHDNTGGPTCGGSNQVAATTPPAPLAPGEFRDVTGGAHAAAIKAIALQEVTNGCTAELYCPNREITRAQMAALLTRARNLPSTSRSYFTDVAGSPHAAAINALAAAGVTGGCGNDRFCPSHPVSRGQMATFLQRAWSLPDPGSGLFGGLLSGSSDAFTDIATSQHRTAVNAIADADITRGCGDNRYCPNQGVTRAEMASFLARIMNLV